MKIIYGTGNKGKMQQVKDFLKVNDLGLELISLKDIGFDQEIDENGKTFEENSMIKAKAIQKYCKNNNICEIILTDDAGLCVDSLNGEPGVHSARYAGDHAPQEVVLEKLLHNMELVNDTKRTAKFVCVLTAILPDGKEIVVRGETNGKIAETPGTMGKLTYGPVFMPEGFNCVMNDLKDEDLGVTYREKALIQLVKKLKIYMEVKNMKKELIIRKCEDCGAMVKVFKDCNCDDCGIKCCGKEMKLQIPNSVDAAIEKHVPTYEKVEDEMFVKVNHVMEKEHYIEWISLVTDNREYFVELYPEQDAEVRLPYIPGSVIYAYCNKHGLWKKEVE